MPPQQRAVACMLCREKGRTDDDGVGEGVAGHEVGLRGARHAAEHLPLAHRVLPRRQLHDLGGCMPDTPLSATSSVIAQQDACPMFIPATPLPKSCAVAPCSSPLAALQPGRFHARQTTVSSYPKASSFSHNNAIEKHFTAGMTGKAQQSA